MATWGQPRSGVHLRVAMMVDKMFRSDGDDAWDFQAFVDYWKGHSYFTPTTEDKWWGHAFDKLVDTDEMESKLYEREAFNYLLWNRSVSCLRDIRAIKYDTFKSGLQDESLAADDSA